MRLLRLSALTLVVLVVAIHSADLTGSARSRTTSDSAASLVTTYISTINADMKSGSFSNLATVYASNATLSISTVKGVTKHINGLSSITRLYQAIQPYLHTLTWTLKGMQTLSPTVVLCYIDVGNGQLTAAARSAHVIVIQNGKVVSHDWIDFYPGKK
jgi:hypothetical protein